MEKFMLLAAAICLGTLLPGQGIVLLPGNESRSILERLELKTAISMPFHPAAQYITRGAATRYALQLYSMEHALTAMDKWDLKFIFKDNNEWLTETAQQQEPLPGKSQLEQALLSPHYERCSIPIAKIFYPTPANMLEVNEPGFFLRVNPLINFQGGLNMTGENSFFLNQRGLDIRGGLDDKIFFHTQILESQAGFPKFVMERIQKDKALPGAALYKPYNSRIFNVQNGYDFLTAQSYVGFNLTPHLGAQLGYGRHFIGSGQRSMLLSDFAHSYPFLRLNWGVWKLHYQNLFAELDIRSANQTPDGVMVSKKYMAAHYLSVQLGRKAHIGLFETVVFSRPNHFAFQYLNPLILYRAVEQATGSPDNVLIGLDGRWNFLKNLQLYGQFMLDEFVFRELITENQGWWANKFGFQAGMKWINAFGLDHLDLQSEFNTARPYTFAHRDSSGSYTHHNQPLAHPLGANFREGVFVARYRPAPRWWTEARIIMAQSGEDYTGQNWGGNPLIPDQTFVNTYGNFTGQGATANITIASLECSYMLAQHVFAELRLFHRQKKSQDPIRNDTTTFIMAGIRANLPKWRMEF
jgi:hypothetical protein